MTRKYPSGYESKFAEFIRMCEEMKSKGVKAILVYSYSMIGDNDAEIQESLARIAEAGLTLRVAVPNN